ncbi:MAG TPA: energy transducer TonB [Sphingomonas sp.]|jgi:TonB family protein|uniref:energy transducer TonB family protein n=1 Tax=Sphingomonas sp. TaxID=28214 RepID=UPI002ED7C4D1
MFTFDRFDAQRIAVSAAGALVFSALCLGAAIVPAQAGVETPATITAWQANAAYRLDQTMAVVPSDIRRYAVRDAQIDATVSADGRVRDPKISQSSGSRAVDAALLRRAATLRLAPLPAATAETAQPVQFRVPLIEGKQAPVSTNPTRYAAR